MTETTLLDIKSDYIFKLVFGNEKNKKVLLSLLNAILKGNPRISNLQLRNSEMSKILEDNKTVRLDIKAEINPQQFIDIEMQVKNTGEIVERAIQSAQVMSVENFRKLTKEEKDDGLVESYKDPKVIGIWILGENIFHDCDNPVTEAGWVRDNRPGFITDKMRLFFIELPKFNPKTIDKKNMLDMWMAFLKNPLFNSECDVPEIHTAFDTLCEVSADPDVRDICRLRFETEFGRESEKNVAVQNAREEEQEKAKQAVAQEQEKAKQALAEAVSNEQEKAKKEKIESAQNLLKAGVSTEIVASSLGLPIEEIQKLIQ